MVWVTHAESVSVVLDVDVPDPAVALEEPLDVLLADVVGEVAQEDAGGVAGRHRGGRAIDPETGTSGGPNGGEWTEEVSNGRWVKAR